MIAQRDLHTFFVEKPLVAGSTKIGTAVLTYEVTAYTDVRNLTETKCYLVKCTQRVIVPNQTPYSLTPPVGTGFSNYPAMLSVNVQPTSLGTGTPTPQLLDYSPRTINTAVQSSLNQSIGTGSSSSQEHSIGSSLSQTNSYSASASLGFFGGDPTGTLGGDYSRSTTASTSNSLATGTESGKQQSTGAGESMSIKDWGSYAAVDSDSTALTWIWGQEYPWDVIQFRTLDTDGSISLPAFVLARLCDGQLLYPPSQLSLFGVDFTMKASWLVVPGYPNSGGDSMQFAHIINLVTASHTLNNGSTPAAAVPTINAAVPFAFPQVPDQPLDLCLLALDQIPNGSTDNGAVVGFAPNRFLVPPANASRFKIVSGANNLLVSGTGFSLPMATAAGQGATLSIQFKILDDADEYSLFFKHWKDSTDGCVLTVVINGDATNAIVKHVDSNEAQGGENNITLVSLRNNDFASIDYHDYLRRGVNTIDVSIVPESSTGSDAVYCLRAIAVGSM